MRDLPSAASPAVSGRMRTSTLTVSEEVLSPSASVSPYVLRFSWNTDPLVLPLRIVCGS